ncbi:F-box/kelch-repeat protein At3g23880-like [Lycium ferocissimum]|uniref:F-box/kelch-repeat protein At3g23880-like n=1 Tax=Lycium ferocissimum TaxID=112874 RepID=UPI002815C055|nr:F-box/kelch-repeat protein At3g23880-like [Lycium ferocissimum]
MEWYASVQHPGRSKLAKYSQVPSISMQDSILTIPTLPVELVTEILLRLPVKSLLQFRCVSKSWLDLLSSPEFIKSHLNLSANNKDNTHHRLMLSYPCTYNFKDWSLRSLLYESDVMEAPDLKWPMKNPPNPFCFTDSVNGLICLIDGSKDLFLWNPSIRKYKKLPDFRTNSRDVVRYTYCDGHSHDVEVNIYSLKSDSWRNIHYLRDGMIFSLPGKFVNGKLYWATFFNGEHPKNSNCPLCEDRNIISIDLVDEKLEKVEQPSYGEGDNDLRLGVLGNDLSVYINNEGKHVSLWVMKKCWTKMFTIKYANYPSSYALPFFMSNKGEIVVGFKSTLMIYNPNDDSLRPAIIKCDGWWYAEIYVESLVSPFSIGGTANAKKTHADKAQIKTIK